MFARTQAKAEQIPLVKVLLTLLSLPFWLLGFVAAVVWLVLRYMCAAVLVGFSDVTSKTKPKTEGTPPDAR